MNFLFFKKSKPEKKEEPTIDIAVPNQTRLTLKPRVTPPATPPPASTVNPFLPKSLGATAPVEPPTDFDNSPSPNDARVTLESVLECVPAEMLKPDLGGASRSTRVAIPANVIIPQLPTGKVSIPLRELVSRLPQTIFIAQRPIAPDKIVSLPLDKIVPQLPADFFQPDARQESLAIDENFLPQPFGDDPGLETVAQVEATATAVAVEEPAPTAPDVDATKSDTGETSVTAPVATEPAPVKSIVARVATDDVKTEAIETAAAPPTPVAPPAPVATPFAPVIEPEPVHASAENRLGYDQEMLDRAMEDAEEDDLFVASNETEEIKPIAVFEAPKPVSVVAEEIKPTEQPQADATHFTPAPVIESNPVIEPTPVAAMAPTAAPTTPQPAQPITPAQPDPVPATVSAPAPVEATVETNLDADRPLSATELSQCLININNCTADDLTRIPGVGPALAQKIIEFRNARGTITDVNQLRQIPGVGNKTFRRIVGAGPSRSKVARPINLLLGAPQEKELTLQEIVRLTAQLPGVTGCIMATEDGMFVTGQLPESLDAQTISAFAPQLFRRVGRYVKELKVGQVRRFSLFTDEQPVSIFYAGKIYLVVIHAPNRFSKTLLNKCERIAKEINRMCTNHVTV